VYLEKTEKSKGRIKQTERPPKHTWKEYLNGEFHNKNVEDEIRIIEDKTCESSQCWKDDIIRIVNSLAFRRLQFKTQVFLSPEGDHFSDRMRHTLSVAQISTRIAERCRINKYLTLAIGLAHDIGHSPYGHAGEIAIDRNIKLGGEPGMFFHHAPQGARVLIYGEYDSRFAFPVAEREEEIHGIAPTIEVINGILNHSESYRDKIELGVDRWKKLEEIVGKPGEKLTAEGECVRISDEIAQCVHDLADAFQSHYITKNDLRYIFDIDLKYPSKFGEELEKFLIEKCILTDGDYPDLDEKGLRIINDYKELIEEKVYVSLEIVTSDNRANHIITQLFNYFFEEDGILKKIENGQYKDKIKDLRKIHHRVHRNIYDNKWIFGLTWPRIIANYISGMTDRYLDNLHEKMFT
jgi:dGTPase